MRTRIAILVILLQALHVFSQKDSRIILDAKTRQPIAYVFISSDDGKITLLSNQEGRLVILPHTNVKHYQFFKMGYARLVLDAEAVYKADTIMMTEKPFELQEVTVDAQTLRTIVKDKRYYVDDYLALPNGDFLLITSQINVKGFKVAYYKKNRGITCTRKFSNEGGEHFFIDCFRNIHLVTGGFSRQVFFNSDSAFNLLPAYTRAKFDSTLALCALKIDSSVIFKTFRPPVVLPGTDFNFTFNSPFLTYVKVSKKSRNNFYSVIYSRELREMIASETSDNNMVQQTFKTSGVRPAISGHAYEAQMDQFFKQVAKPIYAPIFSRNDSVIVFNFQDNRIVFLNKAGSVLKEVELDKNEFSMYHDFEIIYDSEGRQFYYKTREADKAVLAQVNVYTGAFSKKIRLERTFAKNIQVIKDRVFYLVKEKEWDDTCYLYEQNL